MCLTEHTKYIDDWKEITISLSCEGRVRLVDLLLGQLVLILGIESTNEIMKLACKRAKELE